MLNPPFLSLHHLGVQPFRVHHNSAEIACSTQSSQFGLLSFSTLTRIFGKKVQLCNGKDPKVKKKKKILNLIVYPVLLVIST